VNEPQKCFFLRISRLRSCSQNSTSAKAIQFLIEHQTLSGPFNLCAPEAVTNRAFLRAVRRAQRRFPVFTLPAVVLRVLLGELATVALNSQCLLPQRLLEADFPFDYPQLGEALHHLLGETEGRG
jgi:hypothetical protein